MGGANSSKQAAIDLWSQMLNRAKENEWSTFDDPSYVHPGRDAESARRAYLSAGWSHIEIDAHDKEWIARCSDAPETSPGVARHIEVMLDRLSLPIMRAAEQLKVENRDEVHFAVEPKAGPFISTVNVVMTDQSIITMG